MSISSALSNASSGLIAASRTAEVVSSNVANAGTEGYGRREIGRTSAIVGGQSAGVRITGIERNVNDVAIGDRRLADAELSYSDEKLAFLKRLETTIGTPDQPNSLSSQVAALEASLVAASASPDNPIRLNDAVRNARGVADGLNQATRVVQQSRQDADTQIARSVDRLNSSLEDVAKLNNQIRRALSSGGNAAALMDQRQLAIDEIGELVSIREIPRDFGQVALVTNNGTMILDGKVAKISFDQTPVITADMTIGSGALSQIEIEDSPSKVGDASTALGGGRLQALFEIRDTQAVEVQSQLDAAARNLIERFSDPTVDPTLAAGAPGLFTDRGAVADVANEAAIAAREANNAAVDPQQGGESWRIRDGMGAATEGGQADPDQILSYLGALQRSEVPASGNFAGARNLAGTFSDILSEVGFARQQAQVRQGFAADQQFSLANLEQQFGVNTDQELQKLLLIERSYAANAKIIETVDQMIQSLLRI